MTVEIGKPVANFQAVATSGKTVCLDTLKGHQVVIYFYPKDNTPGCTTEGQNFRDRYEAFQQTDTLILGVSRDSVRTHQNFKDKHAFPFELISDPEESLCRQFDVIQPKKLYGKAFMGIERSTFLLDKNGILRQVWRKVKVSGHVEEVLVAAQAFNG